MDPQNNNVIKKSDIPSVLQSDEIFSSKILARQSTVGSCSSRFFYRVAGEGGVPFQWEHHPGKAIKPQPEDVLPPISPPPAVVAMGLPKPCIHFVDEPKARKWSSAWLIKKVKKRLEAHNVRGYFGRPRKISNVDQRSNYGSDRYLSESARYSTSSYASMSSTMSSSSNISFREHKHSSHGDPTSKALFQGRPFTCSPRRLSDIVVYFVRRD